MAWGKLRTSVRPPCSPRSRPSRPCSGSTPRPRTASPCETQTRQPRGPSLADHDQTHGIPPRAVETLDVVHQFAHQKQSASVLTLDVIWSRRIESAQLEVEALSFVLNLDDELPGVHARHDVHVFRGIILVAAKDRVRQCL